jgi:hypothetical protein
MLGANGGKDVAEGGLGSPAGGGHHGVSIGPGQTQLTTPYVKQAAAASRW